MRREKMLRDTVGLELLAPVLDYPMPGIAEAARAAARHFAFRDVELGAALSAHASWLEERTLGEAQERYTVLFDLKPVCTLNLGWHIFGDTYERGTFLAGLVGELKARGIPYVHDLPDYLPTVLRLLAQVGLEDAEVLVGMVVAPAMTKVREALVQSDDAWVEVLRGLAAALEAPDKVITKVQRNNDFLPRRGREEGRLHA